MTILENKARFISEVCSNKLKIQNCKKDVVIERMIENKYKS